MRQLAVSNRAWAGTARSSRVEAGSNRVEAVGSRPKPSTLQYLAADKPFGRYKPETSYEVRQPNVTGQSYLEQARKTRKMLREMTPEKALEIIEFHRNLNFFQALALAQREGKLIVPNDIHDGILTKTTDQEYIKQNYPVWTGTLVIYEKPNAPFGEKVVFNWLIHQANYSISFEVPKQFRGKINCALVVEHPDFEIKTVRENEYELKSVDGANIRLIENFPKENGWYMPDAETKIPHGKKVEEHPDSRYFWGLEFSSYLGPLGRDRDLWYGDVRGCRVGAGDDWSVGLGVALVSLAAIPEKNDSHD